MKRFWSLILSILLAFSLFIAHGESSNLVEFEPRITKTVHLSSDEFMSTGFTRATVAVFLSFDIVWSDLSNESTPDLTQPSFVGCSGDLIYVYAHTKDNNTICIGYLPSEGYAMYTFSGTISDSDIQTAMSEMCTDGYYKNEIDDIKDVMDEVEKMMNN